MAEFAVSSEALAGAASTVTGLVAEFDTGLASTNAAIGALLGGSWSGSAADAFGAGFSEWIAGAGEVREALAGIARLLGEAGVTYATVESDVAASSDSSSVTVTALGSGGAS